MNFFWLFGESFAFAFSALRNNKLRASLSLLGITIGIFAIIAVFTAVDSLERKIQSSVSSLGENVIFIQKWPWAFGPDYPWWKYISRPVPSLKELPEVIRRTKSAEASAFLVYTRKTVYYNTSMVENVTIESVSHDWQQVRNFELQEGRYFTEIESETGRPVCVLGAAVADALFQGQPAVGRSIKVFGRKISVIGVFKKEGESMIGNSLDAHVLLPVNFARQVLDVNNENLDPFIMVRARDGVTNAQLIDDLTGVMRGVRKLKPAADENFALNEVSVLSSQTESIFGVVGIGGWVIGALSILVGGFGIANIMFVSVHERTSQIGIQKSLGAKNYFILLQFLVEAVVLCLIGGLIGLLLVYIGTLILSSAIEFEFVLTRSNIILGLTISALIGIISGFIPSYSASQLDPVTAIRASL